MQVCGVTENIWCCLQCGYAGCGRYTAQVEYVCKRSIHQHTYLSVPVSELSLFYLCLCISCPLLWEQSQPAAVTHSLLSLSCLHLCISVACQAPLSSRRTPLLAGAGHRADLELRGRPIRAHRPSIGVPADHFLLVLLVVFCDDGICAVLEWPESE